MGSRFLENISFGITAGCAVLFSARPDIIYANTWPIFATGILSAVSWLRGIPLIVSFQDVYPESLVSQRRIRRDGLLSKLMQGIDGMIARGCRGIIVISQRFAEIYQQKRGVAPERVHTVANWMDAGAIRPDPEANDFRARKNIPDHAFLVVYGGNIGAAAGLETAISSFAYLRDEQSLYLLAAGEGSSLKNCEALAKEIGCDRIVFHAPYRIEDNTRVLGSANLLVLPTKGGQSKVSVPSKLISYLLSARPVIALALPGSDLAEIIERSGCGWVIEPDRPDLLAAKIKQLMAMKPEELEIHGRSGREFALRNLTREVCLPRVIEILEQAAA